jgi:hypothetical protein
MNERNRVMLKTGVDPVKARRENIREAFYQNNPLPESDFPMQIRRVYLFARVSTQPDYLGLTSRDDMLSFVRSQDLSLPQYNIV